MNEKSHKITLVYDVSLRISFDKIDGFIKVYDGIRSLVTFHCWLYDEIYNRVRYLKSGKSGIKNSVNHDFARIRIDSYNSLSIEKILTFHNDTILIKSVVNKNKNRYYYNIFLEKGSYKDESYTQQF